MVCLCEMIGLTCFVALLLSCSSKAPYQIKMVAFLLGSGIIVLVSIPFMIFRPKDYRNALFPAWACRCLGKAIGITMEIRGLENVNKEHGGVVIINHQSSIDLLVLAYLWPVIGRATVVSKKEVLYLPFFGFGAWLWGTLFINRSKHKDSIQTLNRESKAINERNCKLLLFPEGTRHLGDTLLPFKKGPFHIAIQSDCPIQPIVVSHYNFLNQKRKQLQGHAIIQILPEISSHEYNKDTITELANKCHDIMQNEFRKISHEAKIINSKISF